MEIKTPIVAIIGRPNVGKSTLFNRLAGSRLAIESEERGTTRDRLYSPVRWRGRSFILVDTAGFVERAEDASLREQVEIALSEADQVAFVVDLGTGLLPEDTEVSRELHRRGMPTILVGAKADRGRGADPELLRLGFDEPVRVSAIHGQGTGELLDRIVSKIEPAPRTETSESIRVALLGRPNVGKSSLINWLAPSRAALTSPIPGTTRDSLLAAVDFGGQKIELVDTAGVRRRGKIAPGIERWSVLRSLRGVTSSEIVAVVIDAEEGPTAGDAHLVGLAREEGKGLIIVVNKWDLARDKQSEKDFLVRLRREFSFAPYAVTVFTSAIEGGDPTRIFETIRGIHEERMKRIETPKLNNLLEELTTEKPPSGTGRGRPTIKYATQVAVNPPTFTFFGRNLGRLHFSYRRYLENRLRTAFGFHGTSIVLQFKEEKL